MRLTLAVLILFGAAACRAQEAGIQQPGWRGLAISMAVHGAATGFDSWTSWQRPERNGLLAVNGRFTARSVSIKCGVVGGVSLIEILMVKKWGARHPWIQRAFEIGNFTSAGMLTSAGLSNRRRP
jgi:hypothetical protein